MNSNCDNPGAGAPQAAHKLLMPDQGEAVWWLGENRITFLAGKEDTGGAYAWWADDPPAHAGPPRHLHSREEEGFYILEGSATFQAGAHFAEACAGSFIGVPRGVTHAFQAGPKGARMLTWVAPAGHEGFFREFGVPIDRPPPGPDDFPDIVRLNTVALKYGAVYLGPSDQPMWGTLKCGVGRTPILLNADEGEALATLGSLWFIKAGGRETDGRYAFFEVLLDGRTALPTLRLTNHDAALWVRQGTIGIRLADRLVEAPPRTFLHAPRGTALGIRNLGAAPARALVYTMPAGLEDFLRLAAIPALDRKAAPAGRPGDAERFWEHGKRFGIEFVSD